MSTADFITKEELQNIEYTRVDDSYIPQSVEKPLILPLLWVKGGILLVFILILLLLGFIHHGELNIDAVYFTRDNWSKQLISGFTST